MYQFKKKDSNNNENIIVALGSNFNIAKGDSGIPSFLSGGYLEVAYMPDMRHGPTFNAIFQSIQGYPEFDFSPHIEEIEDDEKKTKNLFYSNKYKNVIFEIISTKQKNLELHDIVVQFKFTS
ncbi:16016_t:CDS:2, partial [Gigaspora rosea]